MFDICYYMYVIGARNCLTELLELVKRAHIASLRDRSYDNIVILKRGLLCGRQTLGRLHITMLYYSRKLIYTI